MVNYLKLLAVGLLGILSVLFVSERSRRKEAERDVSDKEAEIKAKDYIDEIDTEVDAVKAQGARDEIEAIKRDDVDHSGIGGSGMFDNPKDS